MAKRYREEISIQDFHLVHSVLSDLENEKLSPLTISEIDIEERLELDRQKNQLTENNSGPITQWPRREREKWFALIARYEELISLEDIRRLNPDLCQ